MRSRSVVSNSFRPHGLQPTRLLRPWDFPGKSTGVGCQCLLHNSLALNIILPPLCRNCTLEIYQSLLLSSVQSLSHVQLFVTPWTAAGQASLSITNCWSLLKLMSINSDAIQPSHPLLPPLLLLTLIFPTIRVFSNESVLRIRWPKYWSFFSFSISLSNEFSGLISFRIDWFDLLAVQETLSILSSFLTSK